MDTLKDMMFDRDIHAGGFFIIKNAVSKFREYAGPFAGKISYRVNITSKEMIFHVHAPESIFRYGDLIWEGRF